MQIGIYGNNTEMDGSDPAGEWDRKLSEGGGKEREEKKMGQRRR